MTRRLRFAVVLGAAALLSSSCGLGAKESLADEVHAAAQRLEASGAASGMIAVHITLVKSDKPAVPGPPKILPASIDQVPAVFDLDDRSAAVGVKDGDPKTAVLLFRGSDIYQRIAPKTTSLGASAVLSSAATNLAPLVAAYRGITLANPTEPAAADGSTSTTSTTIEHTALRRASRIPREWIAFDFAELDKKDTTKRAGSFAINPTVLLGLLDGVLTGSVERAGSANAELVRYDANVNRDKAERHLDDDERKLIDKIFRANAVSGRTFPAHIWLDRAGGLRRFEVRLRQRLTNVDRADMTVTIDVATTGHDLRIAAPDKKTTATVGSLGQLVTAVARA